MRRIPIRLTRIVATLGPASSDEETLRRLIRAGLNVARLNSAHGDHAGHAEVLERLRRAADECDRFVAVLLDLAGPKLRLLTPGGEPVAVAPGGEVSLWRTLPAAAGPADVASTCPDIVGDAAPGQPVLFGDGAVRMRVARQEADRLVLVSDDAGPLTAGMGINLPETRLGISMPTEKDWRDLEWGLAHGVDYVGLSFVRSAAEVRAVKEFIARAGGTTQVIAKIEKPQALDDIDAILAAADGLMVARGDLGVELDVARVPVLQKDLIRRAAAAGVPVITATQMLQSMIHDPRPTRAEVSDVANAVFDGSDALMLSGETAVGHDPVRAVEMMDHIIDVSEDYAERAAWPAPAEAAARYAWSERAIVAGAAEVARDLDPALVVVLTHSGATALLVSKQGLRVPILGISGRAETCRRMALYRGVIPAHHPDLISQEDLAGEVQRLAVARKLVAAGDRVLIISGYLPGRPGGTDTLRVHTVSDPTERGAS